MSDASDSAPPPAGRPVLRVVAGDATPEELAAVVAAVAAATSHATSTAATSLGTAQPAGTSLWSAPGFAHRNIRATFTPGPDSWRTSLWPR